MNTNATSEPQTNDEIDRLLGSYFKNQMPSPWPTAPQTSLTLVQPTPAVSPSRQSDTLTRSRLALAASVAILLGGCWLLSGKLTNGKAPSINPLENGTANAKILKNLGKAPGK